MQLESAVLTTKEDVYALGILLGQAMTGKQHFLCLQAPQIVGQVAKGQQLPLPPDTAPERSELYDMRIRRDPGMRPDCTQICEGVSNLPEALLCGAGGEHQRTFYRKAVSAPTESAAVAADAAGAY